MTTWGVVTTTHAPKRAVLDFAAWHLQLGAHRLFIYLDAPDDELFEILKAHPRIRPQVTDNGYWDGHKKTRPEKHQPRQTFNATRTYARRADVDWLTHIDVDEFLVPEQPVDQILSALPDDCMTARIRPMEALASVDADKDHWDFKTLPLDRARRRQLALQVWPTFGTYLNGGFLSHVAGKVIVRTGLPEPAFRIHNFYSAQMENPGQCELHDIAFAHMHAKSWHDWYAHYRFRHERGSYRAELKPDRPPEKGGMTLHDLFATLEAESGEAGLRLFFDEVCAATPGHLTRLTQAGLHRRIRMPLDAVREHHFPGQVD